MNYDLPTTATTEIAGFATEELAAYANEQHENVMGALHTAINHAKLAGDALNAAKSKIAHGGWGKWLNANFHASARTARVYMRVSKQWADVERFIEHNQHATLEDVRYYLRQEHPKDGRVDSPSVPEVQMRDGLQRTFAKWLKYLPEPAIFALWQQWEDIWGRVQHYLCDHLGIEFEPGEEPHRPYALEWGQASPGRAMPTEPKFAKGQLRLPFLGDEGQPLQHAEADEWDWDWDDDDTVVYGPPPPPVYGPPAPPKTVVDYRFDDDPVLTELTPIEEHPFGDGTIWLKRDDKFEIGGANGGKVRACWALSQGAVGLVTAGARQSPQMQIVARIAHHLDIPCRCHIPAAPTQKPTPEMQDAEAHGAELVHIPYGYNTHIISKAKNDEKLKDGWTYIPFGMESTDAMNCTRGQVRNIPPDAKRIVIAVGSGMSAAGLLWGLQDANLNVPVLGVRVGAEVEKRLNKFAPPNWANMMEVVTPGVDYKKPVQADVNGVVLDPIYEAKCFKFLQPGDLFWIVGRRAIL